MWFEWMLGCGDDGVSVSWFDSGDVGLEMDCSPSLLCEGPADGSGVRSGFGVVGLVLV